METFFGEDDKSKAESIIERLNAGQKMISLRSSAEDVIAVMEDDKPVIKKLYTMHKGDHGRTVKFEVKEESEGTHRLNGFKGCSEVLPHCSVHVEKKILSRGPTPDTLGLFP